MSLYRNNQSWTFSVNNSFSSKTSGNKILYEKGALFSNSGFSDKSFYFLNSGEIKSEGNSFLFLEGCPKTLFATGVSVVDEGELLPKISSEDGFGFFLKIREDNFDKRPNEDVFLFKNSGEHPVFNCYLSKVKDNNFILKISSGEFNGNPLNNKPCKSIEINNGIGQKIYFANFDSLGGIEIEAVEELSYNEQTSYSKGDDGWSFPNDFSVKIPICVVDFDREAVSSLYNANVSAQNRSFGLGINGKGFTSIM